MGKPNQLHGLDALAALTADVCIVGSGPAGLALAHDLAGRGHRVIVLESGAAKPSPSTHDLSEAEIADAGRHAEASLILCRALGGNAWLWGGRCVPFDSIDFARGTADPERRWPISYGDMAAHYDAAARFLDCGIDFTLPDGAVSKAAARAGMNVDGVERWCAEPVIPLRSAFGSWPPGLTIVTGVTVTDLEIEAGRVGALDVASETGTLRFTGAKLLILAAGGLETARLLLTVQSRHPAAFGGAEGPLGRYYMGHISGHPAKIHFTNPADAKHFRYRDDASAVARARIMLSEPALADENLPNVAFWPANPEMADPSHGNGLLSLIFLVLSTPGLGRHFISEGIRQMQMSSEPRYLRHAANLVTDLPRTLAQVSDLVWQMTAKKRRKPFFFLHAKDGVYALHYHAEHLPNSESRVRLSNARDRLGCRRVAVDIRFTQQDAAGVARAHLRLDEALRTSGIGKVVMDRTPDGLEQLEASILAGASDGYSQIGLTRMGSSPSDGVVDLNCNVFGVDNLYIAGSGVFRSSGQANPTLPAVALALRLAGHVAQRLGASSNVTVAA
jgi:choline dehydrogenase-like flavoprotein